MKILNVKFIVHNDKIVVHVATCTSTGSFSLRLKVYVAVLGLV